MPGTGNKSYIQIGPETTWGTAVAATKRIEITNWNVNPNIGVLYDASLNSVAMSRRGIYQGPFSVKGTFSCRLNYEGLEELMRAVSGTYTTAAAGTGFDHIFKEGATLKSYTIEAILGDVPTGKCFQLTGAKLTDVTVKVTAGSGSDAMVMADFTVLAKDMAPNVTPTGSLTAPAVYPILFSQAIQVQDGTSDSAGSVRVRGVEFTLKNPHTEDRFYLSSQNMDQPLRNDFLAASFKITQEFTTASQFTAARAFTGASGGVGVVFQHPTAYNSTYHREFEVHALSANLKTFTAPVQGYGVIISTAEWEAYYDSATDASAFEIRLRNAQPALT